MHSMAWTKGSSCIDGEFQSMSDLDFYIDKVTYLFIYNEVRLI